LEQDTLIQELRELTERNSDESTDAEEVFAAGDRSRIKNPKAALGRRFVAEDHVGTVTQVTTCNVWYNTDSGQLERMRTFRNVQIIDEEPLLDLESIFRR